MTTDGTSEYEDLDSVESPFSLVAYPTYPLQGQEREMKKTQLSRRKVFKIMFAAVLSPFAIAGCGGGVGEIVLLVTLVKLVAAGAVAVLTVKMASIVVQSAELDLQQKRLELEGYNGREKTKALIELTDDQVKTIMEKGQIELEFSDGKKQVVTVKEK